MPERESVVQQALGLLAGLRAAQEKGWVNQFLQEYGMSSSEGMALLSLAEAFLRVPDPETADQLISDKIGEGDWRAHSGKSNSLLVNSATWGLLIGRAMVEDEQGSTVLRRLINRTGEPFVRIGVGAAMRLMGEVFVMGRTIEEAIERMRSPKNNGFKASFDMLGEAARTFDDAEHYYAAYREAIQAVGREGEARHSISVKLSALHPRYEASQSFRCVPALSERLEALAVEAAKRTVALTVDAEESQRLMLSLDIIEKVARGPKLSGWEGLGMAVQASSKRPRLVCGGRTALARQPGYRASATFRCGPAASGRLGAVAVEAGERNGALSGDSEESQGLVVGLGINETGATRSKPSGLGGLGKAGQAYLERARAVCGWANALGRETGKRMSIRLVKGAYWDSEIKYTQERGESDYTPFTRKAATDVYYLACARA